MIDYDFCKTCRILCSSIQNWINSIRTRSLFHWLLASGISVHSVSLTEVFASQDLLRAQITLKWKWFLLPTIFVLLFVGLRICTKTYFMNFTVLYCRYICTELFFTRRGKASSGYFSKVHKRRRVIDRYPPEVKLSLYHISTLFHCLVCSILLLYWFAATHLDKN